MNNCSFENCDSNLMAKQFWNGKAYCIGHYELLIWEKLSSIYNEWNDGMLSPKNFKYILGRAYDEGYFKNIGDSFLSQSRIKDRSFNFIKTEKGCSFEITRHLNAWDGSGKKVNIVEKWDVDLIERTFTLIGKRKFKKGDFDRN